jgi:4-amino-4-deoxy-L-arabinose transferase-like glycosyltransferase
MKKITSLSEYLAPYFHEGLKIAIWFSLTAAFVIFLINATLSILHPYPLDYGEAPLIDQAMRLAEGQNIYRSSIETPPFTIANYPPLYVLSLIPFLNLFDSPFPMGRMISTIATLASAGFLALTTQRLFKNRLAAIITGVLFLSFPYVVEWSVRARIDSLALGFATGAIFVLVSWPKSTKALVGGGLLLVAAAYTRQSYALAAPLVLLCGCGSRIENAPFNSPFWSEGSGGSSLCWSTA